MTSTSLDSSQSDGMTGKTPSASVGCTQTATGVCRVGAFSPHKSKETNAILNAVGLLGHEPIWIRDGLPPDRILVPNSLPSIQTPVSLRTRHTDALQPWL